MVWHDLKVLSLVIMLALSAYLFRYIGHSGLNQGFSLKAAVLAAYAIFQFLLSGRHIKQSRGISRFVWWLLAGNVLSAGLLLYRLC
jgi:hypothetical protein